MERCGVVLKDGTEVEYANLSEESNEFVLDSQAWVDHDDDIVAIFHTHPNGEPFLSTADRVSQIQTGLPWVLYTGGERKVFQPVARLLGRDFVYGPTDCYALVKDAYHLAGIELPEIVRGDIDDDAKLERIPAGMEEHFFKISDIDFVEVGDVIVTALGGKASHMAIYIGEGRVLHHQYNQMSLRENLSEGWLKRIHSIWRHPDWKTECFEALEQDFGW